MPVTPTLLLKLRETLGEEAATDLVSWVDQATARELGLIRELAELHYGRFDARLEQRLAEMRADLGGRMDGMRAELGERIDGVRAESADVRTELVERIDGVRMDLTGRSETLRADLYGRTETLRADLNDLRTTVAAQRADLIKWMFLFWVGTIVPLAGLMIALVRL